MRHLIIVIFFISFCNSGNCQNFLDTYKKYRLERADTLSNSKTRKKIKNLIKSRIEELDTIFQSYKAKYNFDFTTADTLFLIYDSPAESPFTSDIIIWAGKDTISYKQGFEMTSTKRPFKYKRIITYTPFVYPDKQLKGFKTVTERDSLITLVSKRDYNTIIHLGDNQNILDGSYVTIHVAIKEKDGYKIETCSPRKFIILTTYRKE